MKKLSNIRIEEFFFVQQQKMASEKDYQDKTYKTIYLLTANNVLIHQYRVLIHMI